MNRNNIFFRRLFRRIMQAFLQGLLLIAPISITLFVVYRLFVFTDKLIPLYIPGLGMLVVAAGITLIGFIGSYLIRTPVMIMLNRLLDQIPLIRILYSALKDLMSAFVGQKKKFTRPVRVLINEKTQMYKLGFLTEEDLSSLGMEESMVAVYLPHSYNFSGNLFLVSSAYVEPINAPAAEVMKFIVSGGVTRV